VTCIYRVFQSKLNRVKGRLCSTICGRNGGSEKAAEVRKAVNVSILLNIMSVAPMGRFQLELIDYFTYFFTVVPSNSCVFLSRRPFVVKTFSTVQHPQDLLKMY